MEKDKLRLLQSQLKAAKKEKDALSDQFEKELREKTRKIMDLESKIDAFDIDIADLRNAVEGYFVENRDGSRELMLTFVYGDNDSAEDVREAAQKYADIYNEASLNHDTEKLNKLETISEFSNILKKEFADIVKEQYNSDDIGYIDFDNQSNYTKGSIERTINELFTKYKSIQEKDVIPSLSNFWCNGEMCIVRILYGYAEVFIA